MSIYCTLIHYYPTDKKTYALCSGVIDSSDHLRSRYSCREIKYFVREGTFEKMHTPVYKKRSHPYSKEAKAIEKLYIGNKTRKVDKEVTQEEHLSILYG